MKKPLKPAHLAEDDKLRHDTEQQRQETLARLARELKDQKPSAPAKGKPGNAGHNGDPYNTAGPDLDAWTHGPKR